MSLLLTVFGGTFLRADAKDRTAVLDLCLAQSISYRYFGCDEDGSIFFCCTLPTGRRLLRLAKERGLSLCVEAHIGFLPLLYRHRRRAGLALGGLMILAMLLLSDRFVWDVRVTGNSAMTATEVRAELKECGLGVGSYIPSLRTVELENRVLIASERISWISIHMDGTVANVQIIEHIIPPPEEPTTPANLVANADGQIELVELYRGNCMVSVGQAVREGELLVSGLYDSPTEGYRYTRAAGRVLARTERTFRVEIPLTYEEKVYGKTYCSEITLNFFDFSLKIFKKAGNDSGACDIIKKEKGLDLFGGSALPVGVTVEERLPYTLQAATRSYEQASVLAYAELDRMLSELSSDLQLLEKQIRPTLTETSLVLECTLVCIEDIARQAEFEVIGSP